MTRTNLNNTNIYDSITHVKENDLEDSIVLPITSYENVLNRPKVTKHPESVKGSPFLLFVTDEESLTKTEIKNLIGNVI